MRRVIDIALLCAPLVIIYAIRLATMDIGGMDDMVKKLPQYRNARLLKPKRIRRTTTLVQEFAYTLYSKGGRL